MKPPLTDDQAETLVAIVEFMVLQTTPTPLPPSIRDLTSALGIPSTATVLRRIHSLQDAGYLVDNDGFKGVSRANTRLTQRGDIIGKGMVLYDNLMVE